MNIQIPKYFINIVIWNGAFIYRYNDVRDYQFILLSRRWDCKCLHIFHVIHSKCIHKDIDSLYCMNHDFQFKIHNTFEPAQSMDKINESKIQMLSKLIIKISNTSRSISKHAFCSSVFLVLHCAPHLFLFSMEILQMKTI